MKLPILVVLPAYNEAKRIGRVIQQSLEIVQKVIVVDDGSSDETVQAAKEAGAEVVQHPQNRGKGAAIQTAFQVFEKSNFPWLALLDADGQHAPSDIPAMYQLACEKKMDLIAGNRLGDVSRMPWIRIMTNRFMSWLLSRMIGQRIPDTQCGFRLFSRKLIGTLHLTTDHFDLESELLIQAGKAGFSIGSSSIKTIYEDQSSHIHPFVDTLRFIRLVRRYSRKP